jgi:hypothetical protein
MSMSRADFVAVAEIVSAARENSDTADEAVLNMGVGLSRYFRQTNPRFDTARFLAACGIEERHEIGQPAYALK